MISRAKKTKRPKALSSDEDEDEDEDEDRVREEMRGFIAVSGICLQLFYFKIKKNEILRKGLTNGLFRFDLSKAFFQVFSI